MDQKSEDKYIDDVLGGDPEAFAYFVDTYGGVVFGLVAGIVGSREDAEEITSDVFLKAYSRLGKFRRDSKFSTWIYRIAYNAAVSHTRRRKRVFADIDEGRLPEPSDEEEDALLREADLVRMEAAMQKLSPGDRALLEMFYISQMSTDDIGRVTDLKTDNVKVKLFRARKRLAALIESCRCDNDNEYVPPRRSYGTSK